MQKKDFKSEMQKTLDELDGKIYELRIRAENSGPEKKAEMLREVEIIVKKKQAIEDKIENIESATIDDWKEFMDGLAHAAKDLQSSLDAARAK